MESPEGIFLALPGKPAPGIPLAVKDLFDTAGLVTTYGSSIFAEHVPQETAEAVRLLEAPSYDHAGPMARTVAECVSMMEALVPEFEPAPQPALGDLRVAVAWTEKAARGIRERVEAAAARFPGRERLDFLQGRGNLKVFMR